MQHICDGALHGLLMSPSHWLAREKVRHSSRSSQPVATFCPSDVSHLPPPLLPCVHLEIPVYREEPTQAGNSGVGAAVQIFSETTRSLKSVTGHQDLPALIWGEGGNICQQTASQKPVEPWYLVENMYHKRKTPELQSFIWRLAAFSALSRRISDRLLASVLRLQIGWN